MLYQITSLTKYKKSIDYKGSKLTIPNTSKLLFDKCCVKCLILNPNDSKFLAGEQAEVSSVKIANRELEKQGKIGATYRKFSFLVLLKRHCLNPFISAASFQETTRVLTEAAVQGKEDDLTWTERKRNRWTFDSCRDRLCVPSKNVLNANLQRCKKNIQYQLKKLKHN